MADPELLKIIQQGSKIWNRWKRQQMAGLRFDLSHADLKGVCLPYVHLNDVNLSHADLSHANLRHAYLNNAFLTHINLHATNLRTANLMGAHLSKADLGQAKLYGANLFYADMNGADLSEANLSAADLSTVRASSANLSHADLSGTDLSGANLSNTNLSEADLRSANLSRAKTEGANWTSAIIGGTQLNNLDLRTVIGLETVNHDYPSTIGLDTIYKSHGQIPEAFLRGAGVPETFIINMRALVASLSPIEFYSCFISYSHYNEDFAKRLHTDLQAQGVRCWFAEEDLKIGDHYHRRIDEAIRLYDKLIIVLSETSIQSAWVEREVIAAREKEERQNCEVLFPIRLDDAIMGTDQYWAADLRRRWHIGDFARWKDYNYYQAALDRLLRDLKAHP